MQKISDKGQGLTFWMKKYLTQTIIVPGIELKRISPESVIGVAIINAPKPQGCSEGYGSHSVCVCLH